MRGLGFALCQMPLAGVIIHVRRYVPVSPSLQPWHDLATLRERRELIACFGDAQDLVPFYLCFESSTDSGVSNPPPRHFQGCSKSALTFEAYFRTALCTQSPSERHVDPSCFLPPQRFRTASFSSLFFLFFGGGVSCSSTCLPCCPAPRTRMHCHPSSRSCCVAGLAAIGHHYGRSHR